MNEISISYLYLFEIYESYIFEIYGGCIRCIIFVEQCGLHVDRAYAGKFAASMEMAGFSLSLMLLNDERLECLGNVDPCTRLLVAFT